MASGSGSDLISKATMGAGFLTNSHPFTERRANFLIESDSSVGDAGADVKRSGERRGVRPAIGGSIGC